MLWKLKVGKPNTNHKIFLNYRCVQKDFYLDFSRQVWVTFPLFLPEAQSVTEKFYF